MSVFSNSAVMRSLQLLEALAGLGGDEHRVRVAEGELAAALVVEDVGLVEDEHARRVAGVDLLQDVLDGLGHRDELLLGRRGVDDVQDQVGEPRLLQRGGERVHELMRELADEADGVGHQERAAVQAQRARRRVQRVEQAVADADLGAGQRVEQRRLAGVRVAGERDVGQVRALALGALGRARGLHLLQAALEDRDPVAREAAVGLDLGLARAARADAADAAAGAETLEVRPQAAHAGHVVFELGELDLHLALGGVGVGGEDVEDQRGAVEHRDVQRGLQVALLARRELVVGDDHVRVVLFEQGLELVHLAGAEIEVRVRVVAPLRELADRRGAGGAQELLELLQVIHVRRRSDAEGALLGPAGLRGRGVAGLGCAAVARAFQDRPF